MLDDFLKYIEDNHLVRPGDRVLLAVSGGIDSMVMTELFSRTGIEFGIAHCNFCLRGPESDKDESIVRRFATRLKVRFYSTRFQTENYAGQMGISIQMAARELRYRWFEEVRRENNYDSIAVAHNLNDKIETLLINLTRGTGIAGLTGMKPESNHIIRPLLFSTRNAIDEYSKIRRIIFREDSSNEETKYTRNKIRHLVIPVLKEINPSIERTLNDTADRLNGINEIVNEYIREINKKTFKNKANGTMVTDVSHLMPYIKNRSVIYELFKQFGVTNNLVDDLSNVLKGGTGAMLITPTHRLLKDRQTIIISGHRSEENEKVMVNDLRELRKHAAISSVRSVNNLSGFKIPKNKDVACLDFNKIKFPLMIRRWEPGDSFHPFGMSKKKKLSDYFVDKKFSRIDKEKALIIESSGKIVWIIGERIDNRFRITNNTIKVLIIKASGTSA